MELSFLVCVVCFGCFCSDNLRKIYPPQALSTVQNEDCHLLNFYIGVVSRTRVKIQTIFIKCTSPMGYKKKKTLEGHVKDMHIIRDRGHEGFQHPPPLYYVPHQCHFNFLVERKSSEYMIDATSIPTGRRVPWEPGCSQCLKIIIFPNCNSDII